jgi:endonuclease YncB( thermonuclease family)
MLGADPIAGIASVIDGDTIEIHGRAFGSTASMLPSPPSNAMTQRLSATSAAQRPPRRSMRSWPLHTAVQCEFVSWDRYGR